MHTTKLRCTRAITIAIAAVLALPVSALARPASPHHPSTSPRKAHKSARCARRPPRRSQRRCKKVHKAAHARLVSSSSRLKSHKQNSLNSPSSPAAGPVQAPTLTITGTTYYVSPSGSDSNPGTSPASAWRTVKRVNEASLQPGDGVLFEGGATFSGQTLLPNASGTAGSPIIFGSYSQGNATLPQGVWFRGQDHLGFEHLTIGPTGNLQGTGNDITVEWCSIGNDGLAINAANSNSGWTIDDNTIDHTGNSGMLLEGEDFTVSGNTITNTGLDSSIPYGKHGIYLKVINATVTDNTITNFSADGISVRYRNSTLTGNHINNGQEGIGFFQYDPIAGTSHWTENVITGTTQAGFYVSPSDMGGNTRESFIIERNTIQPAAGVHMNLSAASGTYTVKENTEL